MIIVYHKLKYAYRSQEDREARQKLRKASQLAAAAPVVVPEPTPPQDDFQGTYASICIVCPT